PTHSVPISKVGRSSPVTRQRFGRSIRRYGVFAAKNTKGEVDHTFQRVQYLGVRFDPDEFQQNCLHSRSTFRHIFCHRWLDGNGEVDSCSEAIAGSELRENLCTQPIPTLWWNVSAQTEGCPLRFVRLRRSSCPSGWISGRCVVPK